MLRKKLRRRPLALFVSALILPSLVLAAEPKDVEEPDLPNSGKSTRRIVQSRKSIQPAPGMVVVGSQPDRNGASAERGSSIAGLGSTALAVVALAEFSRATGLDTYDELATRLTNWILFMQRPDGSFAHIYDVKKAAKDEKRQMLYFSGEAALALARMYEVHEQPRYLDATERALDNLVSWYDFVLGAFFYGEEHWTCIAAAEASDRIDMPEALDFCERWAGFNNEVQYREGETPWPSSGGYGVGPLLVPRLTPVASRTEAFISTYEMAHRAGHDTAELRAQVERGLGMLLRYRWDPGPTHLLADPLEAHGGIPGSPVELEVRNDYVQHACSAMIRWSDR